MKCKALTMACMAFLLSGCNTPWYELKLENQRLQSDAGVLAAENEDLHARLRKLGHDVDSKAKQLASIQELKAQRERELEALRKQLEGTGIKVDMENGHAVLTLPNSILFSSGSHQLKGESSKAIKAVTDILNDKYAEAHVSVEGHTDSDPISRSKKKYEDNLELSAQRARAVLKSLVKNGIEATRLKGAFHGPNKPTGQGKKFDRRVEIVLIQ